jgi:predicted Rdx family selenoprotein
VASWMLSELFAAGGGDVNVTVRGGGGGVFQVIIDGVTVFDKASEEDGRTPDLNRAKEIKAQLRNMIEDKTAVAAGD